MKEIDYKFSKKFSDDELLKFEYSPLSWSSKSVYKRIIILCVAILLLFSKYTVAIGVLIIFLLLFTLSMPIWSKRFIRNQNKNSIYQNEEVNYNITNEWIIFSNSNMKSEIKWNRLEVWDKKNNCLVLKLNSFPNIYLPISDLKEKNIYDEIIAICDKNGVEFDNRKSIAKHSRKFTT